MTGGARLAPVMTEVVPAAAIAARIAEMGATIRADYAGREPVLLGVLKGAAPFLADLSRQLPPRLDIDFLSLTRFGSEGRVSITRRQRHLHRRPPRAAGRRHRRHRPHPLVPPRPPRDPGPASLATATLLDKRTRRIVDVPLRYRGFEVGDEFLLGYGLDWEGRYRNLPGLWAVLDLAAFRLDPEAADPGRFRRGR